MSRRNMDQLSQARKEVQELKAILHDVFERVERISSLLADDGELEDNQIQDSSATSTKSNSCTAHSPQNDSSLLFLRQQYAHKMVNPALLFRDLGVLIENDSFEGEKEESEQTICNKDVTNKVGENWDTAMEETCVGGETSMTKRSLNSSDAEKMLANPVCDDITGDISVCDFASEKRDSSVSMDETPEEWDETLPNLCLLV